jgi:hypothetical protein
MAGAGFAASWRRQEAQEAMMSEAARRTRALEILSRRPS